MFNVHKGFGMSLDGGEWGGWEGGGVPTAQSDNSLGLVLFSFSFSFTCARSGRV